MKHDDVDSPSIVVADHACLMDSVNDPSCLGLAKGIAAHSTRLLSSDYVLGEYDVICGRGCRCFNHIGNKRFRKVVEAHLDRYSRAVTKSDKTTIICEIVIHVRSISPDGGFVKKDPMTGRYFEVGDFLAREKTSQAFRDALHEHYKSSNMKKKTRRSLLKFYDNQKSTQGEHDATDGSYLDFPHNGALSVGNILTANSSLMFHNKDKYNEKLDRDVSHQQSTNDRSGDINKNDEVMEVYTPQCDPLLSSSAQNEGPLRASNNDNEGEMLTMATYYNEEFCATMDFLYGKVKGNSNINSFTANRRIAPRRNSLVVTTQSKRYSITTSFIPIWDDDCNDMGVSREGVDDATTVINVTLAEEPLSIYSGHGNGHSKRFLFQNRRDSAIYNSLYLDSHEMGGNAQPENCRSSLTDDKYALCAGSLESIDADDNGNVVINNDDPLDSSAIGARKRFLSGETANNKNEVQVHSKLKNNDKDVMRGLDLVGTKATADGYILDYSNVSKLAYV